MIAKGTDKGTPRNRNENPLVLPRGFSLREQDSNLQPCGYGRFQDFHPGPDYLITLAFGCPNLGHFYVRVSGADGAYRREIRIP